MFNEFTMTKLNILNIKAVLDVEYMPFNQISNSPESAMMGVH